MLVEARSLATLTRWLGPWAPAEATPGGVVRSEVEIDGRFPAWLYQPEGRRAHAAYVIAPGLHFMGPSDARSNRFFSILASAGFTVLAPFLPDYVAVRISEKVIGDFAATLQWYLGWSERPIERPGIFSVSFGSLPALRVAAAPETRDRFSHLIVFGGFANLPATLDFCMTGARRDPLNQPAAFLNFIDYLDDVPEDRDELCAAWHRYLRATWGRAEMKERERHAPVAAEIAAALPAELREMFLIGTGHRPGGIELCQPALVKMGARAAFADPLPHLSGITRPVTIVHGKEDDVICVEQASALAAAFPAGADVKLILTGLYDHSRPAAANALAIAREGRGMIAILRALALGHRSGPSSSFARS